LCGSSTEVKAKLKLIDRLCATHWAPADYWRTIPMDW